VHPFDVFTAEPVLRLALRYKQDGFEQVADCLGDASSNCMNEGGHVSLVLINPRRSQSAGHHFLSFTNSPGTQHSPQPDPFTEIPLTSKQRQQPAPTGQYD